MNSLSEWWPFATFSLRKQRVWEVALENQNPGEKTELWPYDCNEMTLLVAIYAKSFFPPPQMQAEGFLVLRQNGEIIHDLDLCRQAVRDFYIWHRLYFSPVEKHVIAKAKYFSQLRLIEKAFLDNCRKRYESNSYNEDDPAKKAYSDVLKKLDLDVIQNFPLVLRHLETHEKIIDVEKSIWQRCSHEKTKTLETLLKEYQSVCFEMASYTQNRSLLFYDFEKAIKEAYKVDLQVSKHSFLSKLALGLLMWLASTNIYTLAIPLLPETLKLIYQNLAGYRSLAKTSKRYLNKSEQVTDILTLYGQPAEIAKIRNFKPSC